MARYDASLAQPYCAPLAGTSRLRGSSLFRAPSAAALAAASDEPSDHEHGPHENDDHAYADEQIGENDSGATLDAHCRGQSGGWPPRFAARTLNVGRNCARGTGK